MCEICQNATDFLRSKLSQAGIRRAVIFYGSGRSGTKVVTELVGEDLSAGASLPEWGYRIRPILNYSDLAA